MNFLAQPEQWLAAVVVIIVIFVIWKMFVFGSASRKLNDRILIRVKGDAIEIGKMTDELREIAARHGAAVRVRADGNIEIEKLSLNLIDELGTVRLATGSVDVEIELIEG